MRRTAVTGNEVDLLGGNLGSRTVAAASLFTAANGGSDAYAADAYSLSISANGVPSGLLYSANNQSIVLAKNGGVIEGRVTNAGALAFTVSVDAEGNIMLTQLLAVEHPREARAMTSCRLPDRRRSDADGVGDGQRRRYRE